MTLEHATAQEWMQRQLQVALEEPQRAALEEHLAACQDCREYQSRITELHQSLPRIATSAWPEPSFSPIEIEQKLAALHRNRRSTTMHTRISTLARTAAGLAGAALLILAIVFAMKTIPGNPVGPASVPGTPEETATVTVVPTTTNAPSSYTSPRTGLSLTIPAGWESSGDDAFRGPDGFLEIAPLSQPAARLTQACTLEANTHPEFYGEAPKAQWTVIDPYTGCFIWTSLNDIGNARSTLILEYPQDGQLLTLSTDPVHFESILASLRFPQAVATATPISNPPLDSNPPISEAQEESGTFGSLVWEDYDIISANVDTPTHFEFNKRIPQFVFDQRTPWRDSSIQARGREVNALLAPFGYQLMPELWSSVSPDMYALYKDDQVFLADVSSFHPVSVNVSGTDFALVVDVLNGGTKLIQKDSIVDWDASAHAFRPPVYAGDALVSLEKDLNDNSRVRVMKNGQSIYSMATIFVVDEPVKTLGSYQGQWVLEVDGNLIVDGKIVNQELGYREIFNWQLLHGKPFYFFVKDGKVGMSYDAETLPVWYDHVIHYACCEPAAFNPRSYLDMIAFYALKDGNWYYVELGDYSEMPVSEPTPTPLPVPSDLCSSADATKYDDPQGRFCFAYPAGYLQGQESQGFLGFFGPENGQGAEAVRAALFIEIQPLQIDTPLKTAVDIYLSQFQPEQLAKITRTDATLGGEPAEIVEVMPTEQGSRDVFAFHGKWLYHLVFTPSVVDFPQIQQEVEGLFQVVMQTFTFLQ